MNIVTSATAFTDSKGVRLSFSYCKIDESGNVTEDNLRKDIVVYQEDSKQVCLGLLDIAQQYLNNE